MLEFNIAPNTQIGKINIPEKVYIHENVYRMDEEKYSRSGEFIENMVTDNVIEFCKRWFHLAGFEEFLEDIDEYYRQSGLGAYSNLASVFGSPIESPILPTSDYVEEPIEFSGVKTEQPIYFNNKRPKVGV